MAGSGPPVRTGILGYGFAGRGFHAYLLTHEPRLQLTAVATRDPARRARAERDYGVQTFPTLDDMLAGDTVDLVIIATPHDVHAEQAVQVMDSGRHCVTDKVMCLSSAEAEQMIAARDRNGVLFTVFHNRRWDGDYLTVRSLLAEGVIGAPRFFEIGIWRYGAPRNWRSRKAEVGTIMHDWGAHFVDQMFQLVPARATSVVARAQHDWDQVDVESYLGVDVQFDNGVLYRIELSNRARLGKPHWYVVGEKGALSKEGVDPQEAAMLRGDILSASEDPGLRARLVTALGGTVVESSVHTLRGDWTAYYRNVADALEGKAELAVQAEEAARGVRLLEAVQESLASGGVVQFSGGL